MLRPTRQFLPIPRLRTRIRTMSETMNVTEAKTRLSELVAAVSRTHDHFEITRNGEPAAVLMSHAELNALRETIALLSDRDAASDIAEGQADIEAGRLTGLDEIPALLTQRRQVEGA